MIEIQKNGCAEAGSYLYGVSCWIEGKSKGLVERRLPVMSANSGLLLDDPLLGGNIHHVQLDIQIW